MLRPQKPPPCTSSLTVEGLSDYTLSCRGVAQLVAHCVWDAGVGGSSPPTPTWFPFHYCEESMKVFDSSPSNEKMDHLSLIDRFQGSMRHGLSWAGEFEAQQACVHHLGKILGDDYMLLRNVTLKDLDIVIPMILIGPAGLFVFQVTTLIGSYRANEDNWLSLENRRNPKPVQPNLIVRTTLMAKAVDVYLAKNGASAPHSQPLLLCANPHMFVESIHSVVRVVANDTIELFAANLKNETGLITPQIMDQVTTILVPSLPAEIPSVRETPEVEANLNPTQDQVNLLKAGHRSKLTLSRAQWITLSIIVLFWLVALVIVILLTFRPF